MVDKITKKDEEKIEDDKEILDKMNQQLKNEDEAKENFSQKDETTANGHIQPKKINKQ